MYLINSIQCVTLKSTPSLCQCMETDKGVQRSMIHPSSDAANFDGLLVFHTITFGGKKATNLVCPLLSNKKTIQFLHTAVPTCAWAFVSQLSIDYYSTAILPALSNKRSCLCKTVFCKLVCFHKVPINNLQTGIFLSLFLYYNIRIYIQHLDGRPSE